MTIEFGLAHLTLIALIGIMLGLLTGRLSARWAFVGYGLSIVLIVAS